MTGKDLRLLWLFNRVIDGLLEANPNRYDLSPVQFFTLRFIKLHDRPNLGAVAAALAVSNAAATKLIDRLVKKGLVARVPDPLDHREKRLSLTEKGDGLFEASASANDQRLTSIMAGLSQNDRRDLCTGLEAFLNVALSDAEAIQKVCLRCGTEHDDACPGEKLYQKRGGVSRLKF